MAQPDAHEIGSGFPAADTLPAYQQPAFDSKWRGYEEYLDMMHRANDLVIVNVQLRRHIDSLHQALVIVLEETDGGSFLSAQIRDRVQELVQQNTAGIATGFHMYQ